MAHHHRLRQGRETREKGGNGLGNCRDKMANLPDTIKFRAIGCGYKVLSDIKCSLHRLTKVKQRIEGETGHIAPEHISHRDFCGFMFQNIF
jgi:hypothetical protein